MSRVGVDRSSIKYPHPGLRPSLPARGRDKSLMPAAGDKDLPETDHDLEADQDHDDDLEPQRAAGVDDVGKRIGGVGDYFELAVERLDPPDQFIFILEPRIEPLQVGAVP